jgi:hypothetical protein
MLNWIELEQHFRELDEALAYAFIDIQWGSSGEHWRLAGAASPSKKSRFEALSRLAGEHLKTSRLPSMLGLEGNLVETDPTILWYKALKQAGRLRRRNIAQEVDESGNAVGQIFTGYIDRPADASATLCLDLARLQGGTQNEPSPVGSPLDMFDLKPNVFGLGLNLNHILARIIRWWRHRREAR